MHQRHGVCSVFCVSPEQSWCTADSCLSQHSHLFPLAVCSGSHHQVVLRVLAAVFAGAVKVEVLP